MNKFILTMLFAITLFAVTGSVAKAEKSFCEKYPKECSCPAEGW
jgi:hypothetical protein